MSGEPHQVRPSAAGGELSSLRRSKRRRLCSEEPQSESRGYEPPTSARSTFPLASWLEAPLLSPSSVDSSSSSSTFSTTSSSSSPSSSSSSSQSSCSSSYSFTVSLAEDSQADVQNPAVSTLPSLATSPGSLSFLTEEERRWLNGDGGEEQRGAAMAGGAAADMIVISDDEDAFVRRAQMAEDEELARQLQVQGGGTGDGRDRSGRIPQKAHLMPLLLPRPSLMKNRVSAPTFFTTTTIDTTTTTISFTIRI